jgi:hypothetical protein
MVCINWSCTSLNSCLVFEYRYQSKRVTFEYHHVSKYNRTFRVGVVDLGTVTVGDCLLILVTVLVQDSQGYDEISTKLVKISSPFIS